MRPRPAFSTLEILVTVFIFALVFGFSLLYTQLGVLRADLNTQAAILETHLREAQSNATSGRSGAPIGVHFEADRYVLFNTAPYASNDSSNFTVSLPDVLRLQSVVLQGGGSEVIFDAPLGGTDEYGAFELYSQRTDQTLVFTLTALGQISYE